MIIIFCAASQADCHFCAGCGLLGALLDQLGSKVGSLCMSPRLLTKRCTYMCMPAGLEAASDAEDQHAPAAQRTAAPAAAADSAVRTAGTTTTSSSSGRGRGRGSSSSGSGFRRGFLGQPLQQSGWSSEQRQQMQAQQQLRAVQAGIFSSDGDADDEGDDDDDSESSWETASGAFCSMCVEIYAPDVRDRHAHAPVHCQLMSPVPALRLFIFCMVCCVATLVFVQALSFCAFRVCCAC
jgi:hypothetical protein